MDSTTHSIVILGATLGLTTMTQGVLHSQPRG
jgi:hypothetical protein